MDDVIFLATDKETGETIYIKDLYWFEENGVHDMSGEGHYEKYVLEYVYRKEISKK